MKVCCLPHIHKSYITCILIHTVPVLHQLVLLKRTEGRETLRVRIINEASCKWKDIACLILRDSTKMTSLEEKYKDPSECLRETLIEGFIKNKPMKYSQDWNGLIELLKDVDLENLAERVEHARST